MVDALGGVLRAGRPGARDRRRLARRHRRARRPARRRAAPSSTCSTARRRRARPGVHRRLPPRARRRRRARARDGLRLLARSRRRTAPDRGRGGRRRPRARLALRRGRRDPATGAFVRRGDLARRLALRAASMLGARDPRPDRRLQVLPRARARDDRPRRDRLAAATRSRSRRPTARCGPGSAVVEVPIRSATASTGHSKMSAAIVLEAIWKVPLLRLRALGGRL